jgi:hypothetical protein
MSHFYAMISESARKTVPTARGFKSTGITTEACAWGGKVVTRFWHSDGVDKFDVWMMPHHGSGDGELLLSGVVGNAESVEVSKEAA